VSTTTKLVAVLVLVLLIGGLSYWGLEGGGQSVAPQDSAPPVATATAPSTPPAAPAAPPASSTPPAATPATPPTSMAVAPSTPPASLPAEAELSGANRRQIQEALRRLDYYTGPVDGIFGPLTRAAIRRFQREIGADATGYLKADEANRLVSR
jgi:peptidoglycan hydrolase-like protein with peptidoglycan-binding domain